MSQTSESTLKKRLATVFQKFSKLRDLICAEASMFSITGGLAAECFKRAQLFPSSPSLGPRSFATRSRKGLVLENFDHFQHLQL